MTPRPIIGECYDPHGFQVVVRAVSPTHVVCSCSECHAISLDPPHYKEHHVFTRVDDRGQPIGRGECTVLPDLEPAA